MHAKMYLIYVINEEASNKAAEPWKWNGMKWNELKQRGALTHTHVCEGALTRTHKPRDIFAMRQPKRWALYSEHSKVFYPCKLYRSRSDMCVRLSVCLSGCVYKWTGMEIFEKFQTNVENVFGCWYGRPHYRMHCERLDFMVRWHQILLNKNRDTLRTKPQKQIDNFNSGAKLLKMNKIHGENWRWEWVSERERKTRVHRTVAHSSMYSSNTSAGAR